MPHDTKAPTARSESNLPILLSIGWLLAVSAIATFGIINVMHLIAQH
jgi:hypothetical protein